MKFRKILTRGIAMLTTVIMCFSSMTGVDMNSMEVEASVNDPVVVVLDPGHGGRDSGACNASLGTNEKNANWAIAVACRDYLQQYENITVIMTKTGAEDSKTLAQRAQVASDNEADLFVSLHNNSSTSSSANGCEVYISRVEPFASNTKQLAKDICSNLSALGLYNRGVKTRSSTLASYPDDDYYSVIAKCVMDGIPSMIVEHAFVGNAHDAVYLTDPLKLKAMGEADAKAIVKYFNLKLKGSSATGIPTTEVTSYMEDYGWISTSPNGMASGFVTYRKNDHRDKQMEAFKIDLNNEGVSGDLIYQAYLAGTGWLPEVTSGNVAGSTSAGKMIEAIKVNLTGDMASKYDVYYRVLSGTSGWLGWAKNGNPAGMIGFASDVKAIQVKLITKGGTAPSSNVSAYIEVEKAPSTAKIAYSTHIQTYGWEVSEAYDGLTSGTVGASKRLEGIIIRNNTGLSGNVEYQVHCQSYGWMDWVTDGELAGTSGESKRLEAIKIKLTGELGEKYDVYYRVHSQSYGWLDWAKNGQPAGTSGYSKRLEAIEIVLVDKGGAAPGHTTKPYISKAVTYQTHVQTFGWQGAVADGQTSGTSGLAKRLEGIKITNTSGVEGSIRYKVHCQTYGWMDWVSDGKLAGTTGQAKRLEGICIELTGEAAEKFDVYYRVHCQTYGWLDWAKNGEQAGSEGLSKRLEAIQIVFVEKGGAAPGPTTRPFVSGIATTTDVNTTNNASITTMNIGNNESSVTTETTTEVIEEITMEPVVEATTEVTTETIIETSEEAINLPQE